MNALSKLTTTEFKLLLREPMGAFFVLAFPVILLVILGSIPAFREPSEDLNGLRVIDLYTPIIIAMTISMLALNSMPAVLATYREKGILRRMATTPVPPARVLMAQVVLSTVTATAMLVLVLAVARIAFSVALPEQLAGYVLAFLLSVVTMVAIGLFITAIAPNGKAATAIGNLAFFPLMFFAGLWLPRAGMPDVLQRISDFTPLGAAVRAMDDAMAGAFPELLPIGVMLIWTVAAGAAAIRYFRWE